jgi:Lon-like protease
VKRKSRILIFSFVLIIILFVNFYPLPYYVSRPGLAKVLDEIIDVENGYENDGEFMLTTIRIGKANIITFLMTKVNEYYQLEPIEAIRLENETDEEYQIRQLYYMENSQENAIQLAYEKAGKEIKVQMNGIYILNVMDGSPAEGVLKAGDRITSIDGETFDSAKGFTDYIQSKQAGDKIEVTINRNEKIITETIELRIIEEIGKPGIGISLVEDKEIMSNPEVDINTSEIGGPSAGLMFALEIYNQLIDEDITKGFSIAGTGTISPDGKVGPIGGIDQKVVAADKAGAEIFFAPNENGKKESNYEIAVKTAKDIGTDMKIVPVDDFDDAIRFLQTLKEK